MRTLALAVATAVLVLNGCATASRNVPVRYVDPAQYQSFNCYQLQIEFKRSQDRLLELAGKLDQKASKDGMTGVIGAVVFFPMLFTLGGTEQQETEYASLKGEAEAMQQVAFQKRCGTLVAKATSK
jgi:hypothetical protein